MLRQITIDGFLNFKQAITIDDFTPINVVIGENDTGKTSLIKMLYTVSRSLKEYSLKENVAYKKLLSEKLLNVFQPKKNAIGELVTKQSSKKLSCEATFSHNKSHTYFSFGQTTTNTINDCTEHIEISPESFNAVFIPAKEVLTAFDAIAATRENLFMNGFDDTYLDLIKSLRIKSQQGRVATDLSKTNKELLELFEGEITSSDKDNSFVFKKNKSEYSMSLTAEGIKKIGILTTLIKNREISKGTMLFMDEPETALHPKAIRKLAMMLYLISKSGVQIFLTTHSYFLIKQLSIIAKKEKCDINCFSLNKGDDRVTLDVSSLKNGLPKNPIVQEALDMYTQELEVDLK